MEKKEEIDAEIEKNQKQNKIWMKVTPKKYIELQKWKPSRGLLLI